MEYKRLTDKNNLYWAIQETPLIAEIGIYLTDCLNRLAELEDKIENGTLIELPCKVGDTVYYTSPEYYNSLLVEYKVMEISQTREGIRLSVYGSPKEKGLITYLWASFIGKTVFLTREEAEKRLKEIDNG